MAAALLAGALVWALHARFPRDQFLFLYIPAIGAVAYLGGRVPGFAAALISLVTAAYFIFPPVNSLALKPSFWPIMLVFAGAAAAVAEGAARLRDAETASHRLASIVQSAEDAIFSKSPDGVIRTWNLGAERVYGYTAAEAVGRPVTLLSPPDRPNDFPQIMARLRRGERVDHYEAVRVRKDGRHIDVSLSYSPIADAGGRVIGASVIARDITGHKQAEARLREQADLMNLTYDALLVWELGGGITYWNRGAEELYGFSRDEAIGRLSHALLHTVHPGGLTAFLHALEAARRWDGELRQVTKDGREIVVDSRHRLIDRDGRRLVLETNRDITERKQAEQAEAAARRTAEQAASRIGRLQSLTALLSGALTPSDVADVMLRFAVEELGAAAAACVVTDQADTPMTIGVLGHSAELTERWWREPDRITALRDAMGAAQVVWFPSWAAFKARYPAAEPPRDPALRGARAAVPLMLRGLAVGVLYMNFIDERRFDADELVFMLTVGRQCAQAVERARLYGREHRVAATLQGALLPALPQIPGMRIDAVYRAATPESEVGGDWYDVFRLPDGRVTLTVGDVAGHGLGAAVLMGEMRHAIRTAVLAELDPANVLRVADAVLRAGEKGMATAAVAIIDLRTCEFTYAAAGHPPAIIATSGGIETLEPGTIPLGFGESLPVAPAPRPLPRDGLLVLYTDGLIEIDRDLTGGQAMLEAAVAEEYGRRFAEPAHALLDRLTAGRAVLDDIVILTVAVEAGAAP
jgi:PAS domain S-box-containing protein